MNELRYQELLGRVLDEEASPSELDEFSQGLRSVEGRVADFQYNLMLWELFSHQHRSERSAEAFVAAWRTRLAAESTVARFVDRTLEELETHRPSRPWPTAARPSRLATFFNLLRNVRARPWAAALGLGAAVALVAGLYAWWFGPTMGEPVLSDILGGNLVLERAGQLVPAQRGARLFAGDTLRTPAKVTAAISFEPERTRLTIQPGTDLQLGALPGDKQFRLRAGKLEASVTRQRPFHPMLVRTPEAEAQVLGTKFNVIVTTNSTRLEVTEGKVRFTRFSDRASTQVRAGNYAVASSNSVLAALPLTGSILYEYWTNLAGVAWTDLITYTNYPDQPDGQSYIKILGGLEMPSDWADNYGVRLRGFLHPPRTGEYTFWIAAKDEASLYVSPDDNLENKVQMAHSGGAGPRDWERDAAQKSGSVHLTAGRNYYFEVIHKAGVGSDNLAVAWQGPEREREVIPGEFLSPLKPKDKKP